tara:strand:- start:141 stop:947 length:807 start_codon:yes stop_codon:yes gene_type:complete
MTLLSLDQIQAKAPSIFADRPHKDRSSRYVFVDSNKIIQDMEECGWGVSDVRSPKVRIANPVHCKHEITFRSRNENLTFADPRADGIKTYGNYQARVHPEIRLLNSTDGSSRVEFSAGLFAQICSNGLTITLNDFGSFSSKHLGIDSGDIYALTQDFTERVPRFVESIEQFSTVRLDRNQQLAFASEATPLRWGDSSPVAPEDLLVSRRSQDDGDDLWRVFNRVQENMMQGGFSSVNTRRRVRPLSNIGLTNKLNKGLWSLAEAYSLN